MCNIMSSEGDVGFRTALEVLTFGLISRSLALKIIAPCPITSWQIDEETVTFLIFPGSKITVDGDCSHEIKRCLCFGKKL